MWGLAARVGLTAVLVTAVVLRIGVDEALGRILALDPAVSLSAVGVNFLILAVMAAKMRVLLPECSFLLTLRVTLLAQFYGLVLFGQVGGEVAKTVYLARSHDDVPRVVASTLFDRLTGLVGLLSLALIGLALAPDACDPRLGATVAVLFGGLLIGLIILVLPVGRVVERWLPLPRRWLDWLRPTLSALRTYARQPRTALLSVALGVLSQGMIAANAAVLGSGLGIHLPLAVWAVITGVLSVVLLAPVSVAGLGLRDVTLVGLLAGCGVAPDAALALSMSILGLQLLSGAVGGLVSLLPRPVLEPTRAAAEPT